MTTASFMIGAFCDEIADDLETQLQVLIELKIPCLELRAAWGVNVLNRMLATRRLAMKAQSMTFTP